MAVVAIGALIGRRGALVARQMLDVLATAACAPVTAAQIKAVETLLSDPEFRGEIEPGDLTTVIIAMRGEAEREAKLFAAAHKVPLWRALAIVWFRRKPRGRRRAA
jgi:hypothetical protein